MFFKRAELLLPVLSAVATSARKGGARTSLNPGEFSIFTPEYYDHRDNNGDANGHKREKKIMMVVRSLVVIMFTVL